MCFRPYVFPTRKPRYMIGEKDITWLTADAVTPVMFIGF